VAFDREYRLSPGIGQIHPESYPTLFMPIPFDDPGKNHLILPGRKIRRTEVMEDAVNIEFSVGPCTGVCTKEENAFHHSTPPPPSREHGNWQSNLWKSDTESTILRLGISLNVLECGLKPAFGYWGC
jgi:hypothetical protein